MKYLLFDAENSLVGRYDSDIHGSRTIDIANPDYLDGQEAPEFLTVANAACLIPVDAVDVDDVLFFTTIDQADGIWTRDPGTGSITKEPIPAPTTDQKALIAISQRDEFLRIASLRMAPLLDAEAVGSATEEEKSALYQLRNYRIALSRLESQSGFPVNIDWPPSPQL